MSGMQIKIEVIKFPIFCDKCDVRYPADTKFLTVDTNPDYVIGDLIVICPKCLLKLKMELDT